MDSQHPFQVAGEEEWEAMEEIRYQEILGQAVAVEAFLAVGSEETWEDREVEEF
jgi:hypothetical protein